MATFVIPQRPRQLQIRANLPSNYLRSPLRCARLSIASARLAMSVARMAAAAILKVDPRVPGLLHVPSELAAVAYAQVRQVHPLGRLHGLQLSWDLASIVCLMSSGAISASRLRRAAIASRRLYIVQPLANATMQQVAALGPPLTSTGPII